MEITKKANAKLNLSLDLTGVLPNGYHAINTVMQSVTLCDIVTVAEAGAGISLSCSAPDVPADARNTAYKAASLFYKALYDDPAVQIYIEKYIPSQAGLGGGSADAAAVLLALNELHGGALSPEALNGIALNIGADVPFALTGGTKLCLNVGEVTAALPHVTAFAVIAKPERGVNTAEAYRRFDTAGALNHPDNNALLYHLAAGQPEQALKYALNVFEQLTDIPEGEEIKRILAENGAYCAALSGSGSAYFGLFKELAAAERAKTALESLVPFAVVCKTAKESVTNA